MMLFIAEVMASEYCCTAVSLWHDNYASLESGASWRCAQILKQPWQKHSRKVSVFTVNTHRHCIPDSKFTEGTVMRPGFLHTKLSHNFQYFFDFFVQGCFACFGRSSLQSYTSET